MECTKIFSAFDFFYLKKKEKTCGIKKSSEGKEKKNEKCREKKMFTKLLTYSIY